MSSTKSDGSSHVMDVGGHYHRRVRVGDGWKSQHMVDDVVWTRF